MFKKKFKVSGQTLVANKDKKNILNILKNLYNEPEVEKLLTTHSDVRQDKLTSSKDSIYTLISDEEGEIPILACHEAKGNVLELFPSIYALFKVPHLIPTVFHLKTGVESFIINGADLMWPGIERVEYNPIEDDSQEETKDDKGKRAAQKRKQKKLSKHYDSFKKEVAVVFQKQYIVDDEGNTYKQEIPVAIGRRVPNSSTEPLCNPEDITKQSKGVAVQIEHFFLDELWNYGSQQINISDEIPRILVRNADGTIPSQPEETKEEVTEKNPGDEEATEELDQQENEAEDNPTVESGTQSGQADGDFEEEKNQDIKEITPEEMDDLITRNFMFCLVRHVKENQLPMEPSKLQGDLMFKY